MQQTENKTKSNTFQKAMEFFRSRGKVFLTIEAMKAGVHPRTFYAMRDEGIIERLAKGVYRLTDTPVLSNPDLAIVATKVPKGVLCLVSALSYHGITNEIPHQIYLALPKGAEEPRLEYPPLKTFRFGRSMFDEGIEHHKIDGIPLKVYCPEKTIADCFRFRNRIGLNVALEALRFYRQRRRFKADELIRYAKICRVENIIRPYIEAVL
jgi:predicted transcriptional regulator of viral defense system